MSELFPPEDLGRWTNLTSKEKEEWLISACNRFFEDESSTNRSLANRLIEIDGRLIKDELDFFCHFGEAVNGPGGYFGKCFQSFDDCLFGKFGLEFPSSILWSNYSAARAFLPDFCDDLTDAITTVHERQSWYKDNKQAIELILEN